MVVLDVLLYLNLIFLYLCLAQLCLCLCLCLFVFVFVFVCLFVFVFGALVLVQYLVHLPSWQPACISIMIFRMIIIRFAAPFVLVYLSFPVFVFVFES